MVGDVVGNAHEFVERHDRPAVLGRDHPRGHGEILVPRALARPMLCRVQSHGCLVSQTIVAMRPRREPERRNSEPYDERSEAPDMGNAARATTHFPSEARRLCPRVPQCKLNLSKSLPEEQIGHDRTVALRQLDRSEPAAQGGCPPSFGPRHVHRRCPDAGHAGCRFRAQRHGACSRPPRDQAGRRRRRRSSRFRISVRCTSSKPDRNSPRIATAPTRRWPTTGCAMSASRSPPASRRRAPRPRTWPITSRSSLRRCRRWSIASPRCGPAAPGCSSTGRTTPTSPTPSTKAIPPCRPRRSGCAGSFRMNRQATVSLECRGSLAYWDHRNDELVVYLSTQGGHVVRIGMARSARPAGEQGPHHRPRCRRRLRRQEPTSCRKTSRSPRSR